MEIESIPASDAVDQFLLVDSALNALQRRGVAIGEVVYSHARLDDEEESLSDGEDFTRSEEAPKKQRIEKSEDEVFRERFSKILEDVFRDKPFSCGGAILPIASERKNLNLAIRSNTGEWIPAGDIMSLDVKALISNCDLAPYGDLLTQKTVFDPSVRLAYEKKCDDLRLLTKNKNNQPKPRMYRSSQKKDKQEYSMTERVGWINDIGEKINDTFGTKIDLIPHKLNIYGPGGFFKAHVDSPVDPEKTIGSLVVCFPTKHAGGELIVKHGGLPHVFDFASRSDRIQWAAFYSDCIHEVRPVTEGFRVTMTFAIVRADKYWFSYGTAEHDFCVGPQRQEEHEKTVRLFEEEIRNLNDWIGILLSHKYTYKGLSEDALKGVDRLVFETIARAGKKTVLHPVALRFTQYTPFETGTAQKTKKVYLFDHDDLLYLLGEGPRPERDFDDIRFDFYDMGGGRIMKLDHTEGEDF